MSQVVFSKYTDLLPKEVLNQDAPELQRPDEEVVKEVRHAVLCREKNTQGPSDQINIDLTTQKLYSILYTICLRSVFSVHFIQWLQQK